MSTSSLLLKAFNKHFLEFIDDLITICPEQKEIANSKEYLLTMKTANPTVLIKIWYTYIYGPYQEKIDAGDMVFFLNKDYSHDLRLIPNSEQIINTIETSIREPIRSMDSSNMEKCKKYIQLISTISAKYMQEKGL
jgi:hypothetical protein